MYSSGDEGLFQVVVIDRSRTRIGIGSHPCSWEEAWDIAGELNQDEERHSATSCRPRTRWWQVVRAEP